VSSARISLVRASQFLTLSLWGGILLAVSLTGILRDHAAGFLAALRAPGLRHDSRSA
jgi:hypothetical protein